MGSDKGTENDRLSGYTSPEYFEGMMTDDRFHPSDSTRARRGRNAGRMRKDLFEEFCREFAKEMNRLRMELGASITAAKRELGSRLDGRS